MKENNTTYIVCDYFKQCPQFLCLPDFDFSRRLVESDDGELDLSIAAKTGC